MNDKTRTESFSASPSVDADAKDVFSATAMKQTLARAERLIGILRAIRNVNQLITKEDDPRRLIEGACANLTQTLSYHNAWIALLDDAGAVIATAQSGLDGVFDPLREHLLGGEFSDCMRRALEADRVVTTTDPVSECRDCPLATAYRGRVGLTRRLAFRGKTYGILAASVPKAYADDVEEQSLFDEVAGDLAFALHKIGMALRLSESESDLKRARKLAYFGAWHFDLNTGRVIASDETRTIYGVADAELTIPYIQTIPLPPYRKILDAALKALIEKNAPYDVEFEICRPSDGVSRWMHSVAEYEVARNIVVGSIQDITEHKRVEESLWESRAILRAVLDNIPVRVFWKDVNLNYLGCNVAFARDAGFEDPQQLVGKDDFAMGWREQAERYRHDDREVIETGITRLLVPEPQTTPSGKTIHLLTNKVPLRNAEGAVIGVLGTYMDVSEMKHAEEVREKLQAQLNHAQKMQSVGRLAGGVAHDFNNMIMGILGYVELCQEAIGGDHPAHEWLAEITHEAQRSANLTRQLLAFARKQTVTPQVLDLNDVVADMLKMLRRLIGEDIDLSWQPGAEAGAVKIDPGQVDQILANLCVNARDAIKGAGKVTITTKNVSIDADYCAKHAEATPGSYVMLAVGDTGCGMNRETLGNIFEPFFTTKGVGKGTGLGLATVYGIVRQNSGFVHVESELGKGSTFTIYLPRHLALAVQEPDKEPKRPRVRGHETILLVEDEPSILKMTSIRLQREGYTVLAAGTPGEAIRLATEHRGEVHLILSDVVMPEMNGRDLVKQLLTLHPTVKCLFMSGYTADVIAHNGVLDEDVNFIQKPFSTDDLLVKVREVLEQ